MYFLYYCTFKYFKCMHIFYIIYLLWIFNILKCFNKRINAYFAFLCLSAYMSYCWRIYSTLDYYHVWHFFFTCRHFDSSRSVRVKIIKFLPVKSPYSPYECADITTESTQSKGHVMLLLSYTISLIIRPKMWNNITYLL